MTAFQVPFRMSNACARFDSLPSGGAVHTTSTRITYLR